MRPILLTLLFFACPAHAAFVEIIAARDATMYSNPTQTPLANGAGEYFFAGEVSENDDFQDRRALLYFDVAAYVPAGMYITSATLRLYVNRKPPSARATDPFTLHVAETAWTTGASNPSGTEGTGTSAQPNDATWLHASYSNAAWTTPGGDFAASASAMQDIGDVGAYEFATAAMIADVQAWLDAPAANFGYVLIGDETIDQSIRRFYSVESGEDTAPTLVLEYDVVPEPRTWALVIAGFAAWAGRRRHASLDGSKG